MPVKRGVEVAVSTAREGPGRGRLPGRGCGSHSSSIPVAGPDWAFHLSPWADAIPPCLHLAGSPRPGLGARTRRQELLRGPSPPPGHDITHWNWHSPQGHLRSSCGFIPPAKTKELGTLGTGSTQGRQRAHRLHVAGTCTATVLHSTSESWAKGQRREPTTGQNDLVGFFPGVPLTQCVTMAELFLVLRTTRPGREAHRK